jgi:ubiquitin carboxyl-terminal hydrolase 5/13
VSDGDRQKTVKSTAELEVELNASYAFDAITEAGASLVPVTGPSLQGLQNLGNSCYMNSVVQMLLSGTIPELASRYGTAPNGDVTSNSLLNVAPTDASTDLLCQTAKLSSALTSGTFAGPVPESAVVSDESTLTASNDPKYRLPPRMFKHLIGRDHVDFCTNQQQDAAQFLQYLFEKLDRAEIAAAKRGRLTNKVNGSSEEGVVGTSSNLFAFQSETRLVCQEDQKVKYTENAPETVLSLRIPMEEAVKGSGDEDSEPEEKKHKSENTDGDEKMEEEVPTVLFKSCIDSWASSQEIDGLRWPHLNNKVSVATGENRFSNFPRFLLFQMRRYELGADWTPKKIEVNIDMPDEVDLSHLRASGPQSGESLVPEEDETNAATPSSAPAIDESALGQLMDMGFNMNGCKRALNAVGGSDMESAMNWIFEHSSDPDFNDPMPEKGAESASSGPDVDEATVSSLVANLGCFTSDQVRAALKECGGAADRAADWLFSHMDDLDGAITKLQSNSATEVVGSTTPSSKTLEDGDGRYKLVGLVSHIGKNTESGHYVAHLKKEGKWVIFNDEKVALSEKPPIQHAYLYLFQRVDSFGSPNMSY